MGLLRFVLVASLINRTLMSPVATKHIAAFDEIAIVNEHYAKYQDGRLWQVDMKIPRRNVGVTGVDGSAPIRDTTSLWPGGVIPYTIAYSIRKFISVLFIEESFLMKMVHLAVVDHPLWRQVH
ncbi:hypothetical protein OS493_013536 [Desmophyllum pertusum]|uniref:Uncharacterized protein n=1 Tax=Desmophyllum pertusum TaxID=174260 RepID=A0A9X0A3G5_9CNID|nr:hypothetical protein OS493_013536 [Desmophyllum pertusum]